MKIKFQVKANNEGNQRTLGLLYLKQKGKFIKL